MPVPPPGPGVKTQLTPEELVKLTAVAEYIVKKNGNPPADSFNLKLNVGHLTAREMSLQGEYGRDNSFNLQTITIGRHELLGVHRFFYYDIDPRSGKITAASSDIPGMDYEEIIVVTEDGTVIDEVVTETTSVLDDGSVLDW